MSKCFYNFDKLLKGFQEFGGENEKILRKPYYTNCTIIYTYVKKSKDGEI